MLDLSQHANLILQRFATGVTIREIAQELTQAGVANGMTYDRGYHVRQFLRAHGRLAPAHKHIKTNPAPEPQSVRCPHCGKPICPHCGKPI